MAAIIFKKITVEEEEKVRGGDNTNPYPIYFQDTIPPDNNSTPHWWKQIKKVHLILIILMIGILILIIIFSFNPIVIGFGILGSIASIIGLIKEVSSPIEEKLDTISKRLDRFDSIERDRLIIGLKEKIKVLEAGLNDESTGNTKERKKVPRKEKRCQASKEPGAWKRKRLPPDA
jgi:hypothetical protein